MKEFRRQGINSLDAGNAALPAFMAAYNARFAKVAGDARDMHRPVTGTDDLDTAFSWQEGRTVSGTLVHTDEYAVCACLPAWGHQHKTVCHERRRKRPNVNERFHGPLVLARRELERTGLCLDGVGQGGRRSLLLT